MKRILLSIIGVALLLTACEVNQLPKIEQLPFRTVVEYTPGTYQIEVSGNVTPDALYPWLSFNQNGNTVSFTVTRNTQDVVRRAEFSIAGTSDKLVISQKAHGLDASVTTSLAGQGAGSIDVIATLDTKFAADYAQWGLIYGTSPDVTAGKTVAQKGAPAVGDNAATLEGLQEGVDYYVWSYVVSTEGDQIVGNVVAVLSPVFVRAGDNLQKAIDNAKEFQEIRVAGGATFGSIVFDSKNKNKSISGGWNEDFSSQDPENYSVIDAKGICQAVVIAADASASAGITGAVEISYFEIKNGKGSYGGGVFACGGPVTVRNCYIHDNFADSRGGGVATGKEIPSELYLVNNIIENNVCAEHGAAISIETGCPDDGEPPYTYAVILGNLIVGNEETADTGYASSIYTAYSVDVQIVNNTITENKSTDVGYPGFKIRGDGRICLFNNLVVGNLTTPTHAEANYDRNITSIDVSGAKAAVAFNIVEGALNGCENCLVNSDNVRKDVGFALSEVFDSVYRPVGQAVGFGTLKTYNYSSNAHPEDVNSCNVEALLAKYPLDLAGNPRVVGGKVDCGCYAQ